jgi:hypothetical protein
MNAVIKFEKTQFASGIIFYCNGLGFTLRFENPKFRDDAYDAINKAIIERDDFVDIDITAITD